MVNTWSISPDYSFRFDPDDYREVYKTADIAFANGDYLMAAQMAASDAELKGCSLALGGLLEQGLEILDRLASPTGRAAVCRGFALWSLNRRDEAVSVLAQCQDPMWTVAAGKLRDLIERGNVNVFITGAIQSIFAEHHSDSFTSPSYKYGNITVKYVGSQLPENAYDYHLHDPLDEFIDGLPSDEKPDILFSLSPQWLLAKNFHKVAVPKVIWTHDSDAFQYRNADNFALYDVAICNCSAEHFELSRATPGIYCAANMLLHPLATPFPEARPDSEKTIDVLFTGSAMAPFHSEKPRFLFDLAKLAETYNVRVVEGHMPEQEYFELISSAKFLPIVNRYPGMPSPRWRDALANGAFLLYPEGTFYDVIAPGCFSFRAESMVEDVRRHLESFAARRDPAYDISDVAPKINDVFKIHRQPREESFERLLKYALFTALVWPRPSVKEVPRHQRRLVWLTPAVDCGLFGHANVQNHVGSLLERIDADDLRDAVGYNNAAHLYAQMVFVFGESGQRDARAAMADRYFEEGLEKYPNSLMLLFNRAHWEIFKPKKNSALAISKLEEILARLSELDFDPNGADIAFAYTLHDTDPVFPCYEYADVATRELVLRRTPQLRERRQVKYGTRQIIEAACHGLIGWEHIKNGNNEVGFARLKKAIGIYPDGVPTLRLYLDSLLRSSSEKRRLSKSEAVNLAMAMIKAANANPSILLSHTYPVALLLADADQERPLREILRAWYQLANIVHSLRPDGPALIESRMDAVWRCREYLPDSLRTKIANAHATGIERVNLTQLERDLTGAAERRRKGETEGTWERGTHRLLSELYEGLYFDRPTVRGLRRGFSIWRKAPTAVKIAYLTKALRMVMRGELGEVFIKISAWTQHSKWAKGPALNQGAGSQALPAGPSRFGGAFLRKWFNFRAYRIFRKRD